MKVLKNASLVLLLSSLLVFFPCCQSKQSSIKADLVVKNAKVITIDNNHPRAEAVAVNNGKFIAVTTNKKINKYIEAGKTKIIDAKNHLVLPGFNDSHIHFTSGGQALMNLELRDVNDIEKIQQMVKEKVKQSKKVELIRGRGWDHEKFQDKKWPTKEMLDKVAPENPVILSRVDGHSVWVNSYVLDKSNIDKNTPDPPGGTIVKDPDTGEPTGILKEKAQNLINVDYYNIRDEEKRKKEAIKLAMEKARHLGITSIQHLNGDYKTLQKLKDEGALTLRVTFNMWLTDDKKELQEYKQLREKYPPTNNWLRFGYLKAFIDGTLGSGTALMFEPFKDDPTTSGLPQMPYKELEKKVLLADRMGFQIGIHAIGTKANHWILNAYETAQKVNGQRDSRHRSEHAQILKYEDISRFAKIGVIASMQPTHCIMDKIFAEKRIGLERCRWSYAWKTLLKNNVHVAFGTDWPVAKLNPFLGLYASVTRQDTEVNPAEGWIPEERISIEKAIELYTLGSAYAEFMEDRKGRIKKGMLADMIIISKDIFNIPYKQIPKTKVVYTIVGGKVVYKNIKNF